MVIDLGTDGEDRILQVRWADGSVDSVRPDELRLQEAVTMSNARKLIEAVVQGASPSRVLEDIGPDPVPTGPMVGTHPAADVPPMPEDPCFMYRTSFDSGGSGPHAHIAMLDDTGNGTTDEEMDSQHSVLRFEVQPDGKDGHVHTLDQGTRRDVPSSTEPANQPTSFHSLLADPNRWE